MSRTIKAPSDVDPDMFLIASYFGGKLSQVERAGVENRVNYDSAFFNKVVPFLGCFLGGTRPTAHSGMRTTIEERLARTSGRWADNMTEADWAEVDRRLAEEPFPGAFTDEDFLHEFERSRQPRSPNEEGSTSAEGQRDWLSDSYVDPDMLLVCDYLNGELSPSEIADLEDRALNDEPFFSKLGIPIALALHDVLRHRTMRVALARHHERLVEHSRAIRDTKPPLPDIDRRRPSR